MLLNENSVVREHLLAASVAAWLPAADPAAQGMILDFMQRASASGLDPVAALRDNLAYWFGTQASLLLPTLGAQLRPAVPAVMTIEPLAPFPRPTMWPQRPKRIPGELLTSWIWRTALAAGVPPKTFAHEVLDADIDDIDMDVSPSTLRRLAQLSGQTYSHLAAGTLGDTADCGEDTASGVIESVLLRDGRFQLQRNGRDRLGRKLTALQYCPQCLECDARPYFRRVWRLSHLVVCLEHRCRLYDRCWQCDAPIEPLEQRSFATQPHCASCHAMLSKAGHIAAKGLTQRQEALDALLFYLGIHVSNPERSIHLEALLHQFHGIPGGSVTMRAQGLAALRASNVDLWFGTATSTMHAENLRILSSCRSYNNLEKAAERRKRRQSVGILAAERTPI